jgi:acyl-CoA synthetase (AMP-forming)/AMP-acid ligase II
VTPVAVDPIRRDNRRLSVSAGGSMIMVQVLATSLNVADRLDEIARLMPQATAIAEPTRRMVGGQRVYRTVTFRELAEDVDRIARGLFAYGAKRGTRLALLVPPSIDFITLVFALLKSGAVQILIDPGMGKRNLLHCLAEAEPEGFVAVPRVQAIRSILRRRFPHAKLNVTVGRRFWPGGISLHQLRRLSLCGTHSDEVAANDPAAIIFTSGSTGPPKGVLYRHGNFDRQVTEIRDMYGIEPGEIDLPCFALFGLFNAAMGVTTVLPRMDFSHPAKVDPRNIVEAVQQWNVTQSFASPAVWKRVGLYCLAKRMRLHSLARVMSAGAPVAAQVLAPLKDIIHLKGEVHVPYGATEALPVATIAATEVLSQTWPLTQQGRGVCVGRRFAGIEWRVIQVVDGPIATIDDAEELAPGEIGELIVRGPAVTTEYVTRCEANALAKITDLECGDLSPLSVSKQPQPSLELEVALKPKTVTSHRTPNIWHRMGDCGYLDDQERFWFCGRMSQRVVTQGGVLYTIPIEACFNLLEEVTRCALVGIGPRGRQQAAVVLEFSPIRHQQLRSTGAMDQIAEAIRQTMLSTGVRHLLVYPRSLPVDVRHNAKIGREQLAVWAEIQLSRARSPRCVLVRDLS